MFMFVKVKRIVFPAKQLIWFRICNGWTKKKEFFERFSKLELLTILSHIVKLNNNYVIHLINQAWFDGDYYYNFRAALNYFLHKKKMARAMFNYINYR